MSSATRMVETSESRSFMPGTVRHPRPNLHPKSPIVRRLRLARDLGISLAVLDKGLYGECSWSARAAAVVLSDVAAGDHEAAAQWLGPIYAAEMGEVPHFMDALCAYDEADVEEDRVEASLHHKHLDELTDEELDAYLVAVGRELYKGTRLLCAGHAEQKRRRMAK